MKKYLILILFATALLGQSCMFFETKTTQNNEIDADVRAELAPLNKKIFNALMQRDVKGVKKLMSKAMLDSSGKKIDTIVNTVANTFKAKDYTILDEFYTTNAIPGKTITIETNKGTLNNYIVAFGALNRNLYTCILVSKGLPINFALFCVYGKYDDVWKLNIMSVNNYSILDKTAPEYYAEAVNKIHKQDTIDAAIDILVASQVGTPGGKHWKYQDDNDMQTFFTSTISEANATYHFPIRLNQIKTAPQLFSITPYLIEGIKDRGIYPMVKYVSAIKITDTVALKKENYSLQKITGNLFTGIDKDKKYIIYEAYNIGADGKPLPQYYKFVQTL